MMNPSDAHEGETPARDNNMRLANFLLRLRLWAAFFLTLLGLGILGKSESDPQRVLGAILGAIGLTYLFLFWRAGDKNA